MGSRVRGVLGKLKSPAVLAGVGIAGIGLAVGALNNRIGKAAEIRNFARIAQVNTKALQEWGNATRFTGGDTEDFVDAIREMQLRLAEAAALTSGPAVDALDLLGLSLKDLEGLDAPAQFDLLRNAISEVEDPAQRLFLAEELLGGSSERLQGLLSLSSDELARLRQEAHDTGQIMSGETVDALADTGVAFDRIKAQLGGVVNELVAEVAPAILEFVELLGGVLKDGIEIARKLFGPKEGLTGTLKDVREAFDFMVSFVREVIKLWVDTVSEKVTEFTNLFVGIIEFVKSVFTGDWDAAWQAVKDIFDALWNGLVDSITLPLDAVLRLFNIFGVDLLGFARGVANEFIGFFEGMTNGVIGALNEIIKAWNVFVDIAAAIPGLAGLGGLAVGTIDPIKLGRLSENIAEQRRGAFGLPSLDALPRARDVLGDFAASAGIRQVEQQRLQYESADGSPRSFLHDIADAFTQERRVEDFEDARRGLGLPSLDALLQAGDDLGDVVQLVRGNSRPLVDQGLATALADIRQVEQQRLRYESADGSPRSLIHEIADAFMQGRADAIMQESSSGIGGGRSRGGGGGRRRRRRRMRVQRDRGDR